VACAAAAEEEKEPEKAPEEAVSEVAADEEDAKEEDKLEDEEKEAQDGEEGVEEKEVEEEVEAKPKKWACTDCGVMNFAQSEECHKCGAQKPSEAEMALLEARGEAKQEVANTIDGLLRLQAELQNYRRQHGEAMSKAQELGKQDALKKLLPFQEEIAAAVEPQEGMSEKEQALVDSYGLLFQKVSGIWDKFNATPMEVDVGDKLDIINHRKVGEREAEGEEEVPGTIVEVVKQGWKYEGKVLIPSEVKIVAFPAQEEASTEAAPEETEEANEEEGDEGEEDVKTEEVKA